MNNRLKSVAHLRVALFLCLAELPRYPVQVDSVRTLAIQNPHIAYIVLIETVTV